MSAEYFDVNRIVKIIFQEEKKKNFKYVQPKPIKFLGFFNTGKFTEEGYIEDTDFLPDFYTINRLLELGYKICKDTKRVYSRASVVIYLEHDKIVKRRFEDNESAMAWIASLIAMSDKKFETVNF